MGAGYRAGLYLRLSREDAARSGKSGENRHGKESASIENQRAILTEYARINGWEVSKIYADDGYPGGGFERPAFLEMLKDAENGLLDIILVKDLSRLGRSHIEVDDYAENIFPSLGVRFIAVADGVDTESETDMLPFRSLLNDYYLKDLSRKVASAFHFRAGEGRFIGRFAAYGYKKHPDGGGRLAVEPPEAAVVRRIFDLRLQGLSRGKIAGILNAEGIPSPGSPRFGAGGAADKVWLERAVARILENEVYLGHCVGLKTGGVSYKSKKRCMRPKSGWVRVENTHEAVISQKLWDAVHSAEMVRACAKAPDIRRRGLFSGLLICENGHRLCVGSDNKKYGGKAKRYRYYYCPAHKQSGGGICSRHTVSERALLRLVREDAGLRLNGAEPDAERVERKARKEFEDNYLKDIKKEISGASAKLRESDERLARLYFQRLAGIVSPETLAAVSDSAPAEREEAAARLQRLNDGLDAAEAVLNDSRRSLCTAREYLELNELDCAAVQALVKKIEIGGREYGEGKTVPRMSVKIVYRF